MNDTPMREEEQRDVAASHILQAMQKSLEDGVQPEVMKLVTLSAAVTGLVSDYGEEATASILESLPEKVRSGHFTAPEQGANDA
jgi:hypothetical protein